MKKFLLSLAMAVCLGMGASAATHTYGYAGDEMTGVGTYTSGTNYAAAIKVPAEVAAQMKGSKVTIVNVGFHSGVAKAVNVFITKDLYGTPVVTKSGNVRARQITNFVLDTPYEIDGDEFYIGYTYRQSTATGTPIAFDGNKAGANDCFDMLAVYSDGGEAKYDHYGDQFGALMISAVVDGDNYPKNAALVYKVATPSRTYPGDQIPYTLSIKNMGADPISSVTVSTQVGDGAVAGGEYTFDTPVAFGETGSLEFSGTSNEDTLALPISGSVMKVNGADNVWGGYTTTATMINSATVSTRMPVIEEYTGTGCGYCPIGWLGLENMRDKYPNDAICIGVHLYNSTDPMYVKSYQAWAAANITGAPQATCNRSKKIGTFSPSVAACEAAYAEISKDIVSTPVRIWAWYPENGDKTQIETRVNVIPAEDMDNLNYGLAWVYTRDGMGPYYQSNYYAGGGLGTMGGFESLPSSTPLMYNDVARNIFYWNGMTGSVPTSLKKGHTHVYDFTVPLNTADKEDVHGDLNFIVLLCNKSTGEIVTAAKCKIGEKPTPEQSGVDAPYESVAPADIIAAPGMICVDGDVEFFDIYNLDGTHVASAQGAATVSVAPGMYIVRAKAAGKFSTAKVAVK